MGLRLITPPAEEPLTLDEAKAQVRITHAAEDALLMGYIAAARERCESYQRRAYLSQTWELTLDRFPCDGWRGHYGAIRLPRPPAQSVESVTYIDGDGTLQTLDAGAYRLKAGSEPAVLVPAYGTAWPATRCEPDAVVIRYVAGYADVSAVPESVRMAMRFYLAHYYANREQVVTGTIATELPETAKALLDSDRVPAVET